MLYPEFILSAAKAAIPMLLSRILVGNNARTLKNKKSQIKKQPGYCFLFQCNSIEKERNRFTQNTKNKIVHNKKLAMN